MEKPKWNKPELIILIRGKVEEMVLLKCQWLGGSDDGQSALNGCADRLPAVAGYPATCAACSGTC